MNGARFLSSLRADEQAERVLLPEHVGDDDVGRGPRGACS